MFDQGTIANHNDSIWNNTNYLTRGEEYSTISSTSGASKFINITGDITIELDISTSMPMTEALLRVNNTGTTLASITGEDCNMSVDEWKHLKITIKNNKLTIENSSIVDYDVTGFNRLYLRIIANQQIQFKNLMIYLV